MAFLFNSTFLFFFKSLAKEAAVAESAIMKRERTCFCKHRSHLPSKRGGWSSPPTFETAGLDFASTTEDPETARKILGFDRRTWKG